jgi:hypothetical protein
LSFACFVPGTNRSSKLLTVLKMQIFVKDTATRTLNVEPTTTLGELKSMIAAKFRAPVGSFSLAGGAGMNDLCHHSDRLTLMDFNIQKVQPVFLVQWYVSIGG